MELWKSFPLDHDVFGSIEMDKFCPPLFVQAMTSLLLHKVSILYILGLLWTPPSLRHPFWMIPYRKIIEKYRNISLLNWYGYCGTDMKILETKLLLQNWFGNIEFCIDIATFTTQYWNHIRYCYSRIIWNYWSLYGIAIFIWKYWYPYWYCRKLLIILKLVSIF